MFEVEARWGFNLFKSRKPFSRDEFLFFVNTYGDLKVYTVYVEINGDIRKFKGTRQDLYKELEWMFI